MTLPPDYWKRAPGCEEYRDAAFYRNNPGFEQSRLNGEAAAALLPARASKGGDFLKAYRPLSYTIAGVLPGGYLYGLTARRSTGKTAYFILVTCGRIKIGSRVAYVTKENPDDFRMKLAANCYVHGIDHKLANEMLLVLDGRTDSPEAICERLRIDGEDNGPFDLALYDTFQAGFASSGGTDFNNNAEVLKFLERFRPMTELVGSPPILTAFHPTKNAGEEELYPFGGGAIMNELDGNLTLWSDAPHQVKLHHNRVRGPEFEPQYFHIEKLSCPDIVDVDNAQILLPVMRPTTAENVEARQNQEGNIGREVLRAMAAEPDGTQDDWAKAVSRSKSTVNAKLQSLKAGRFVEPSLGNKWRLTPKGIKEAGTR